jgi:hypothetical protein
MPEPQPPTPPVKAGRNPALVGVLACCGLGVLLLVIVTIAAIASPSKPKEDVAAVAGTTAPQVTKPASPTFTTTPPTTAAPTTTVPPTTAPPTTEAPKETPGQSNARRQAQQYLRTSAFSRAGLIHQLSSPYGGKFSLEDATYGTDAVNANWNEQAVRAAKEYLDSSPFSRDGLIHQLSSAYGGQFTYDEAVYGVNGAGL